MSLDLNNLSADEQVFADALESQGLPVTEADLKAAWQTEVDASGFTVTNTSSYSPFWSLLTAVVTKPVYWLIALLVRSVMPNLFVKTAAGSFLDILASDYGVTRKAASKAAGQLTFSRVDTSGDLLIPAGTRVRTVTINGTQYELETTADATMLDGIGELDVAAEALAVGAAYNLGAGYYSILVSYLPDVTVTNGADWLDTPGADEESDEALRLRVRNQFAAVGDWHIDAVYTAMIAEFAGIDVDRIFYDHDIPRGPGSADAYILYDADATPAAQITAINDYINTQGNHGHGDDLQAFAMPETTHSFTLDVYFETGTATAKKTEVLAAIVLMVECAFRKNTDYDDQVTKVYPESRFSMSRLCGEIHDYFDEVRSVVTAQGDIVSALTVPRLDVLTVQEGA